MRARHQMKKPERLNLIPILDSVFIFIFFLLLSAQFVDIYEIGSTVPMVKETTTPPPEKNPLNLVVEVHDSKVVVRKGKNEQVVGEFTDSQWNELRALVTGLKEKHPNEKTAMLRPQGKVPFYRLIKTIDYVQHGEKERKLFEEVVFDGRGQK